MSKRKNVEKEDFKGTRDLAIANNTCLGIQHVKSGGAIHTLFKNGKRLGEYYE